MTQMLEKNSNWCKLEAHSDSFAPLGQRFRLDHDEPKRLAEWRQLRIENPLHGTPLFTEPREPGQLAPGDPIHLLEDIEEAYPSMTSEQSV